MVLHTFYQCTYIQPQKNEISERKGSHALNEIENYVLKEAKCNLFVTILFLKIFLFFSR